MRKTRDLCGGSADGTIGVQNRVRGRIQRYELVRYAPFNAGPENASDWQDDPNPFNQQITEKTFFTIETGKNSEPLAQGLMLKHIVVFNDTKKPQGGNALPALFTLTDSRLQLSLYFGVFEEISPLSTTASTNTAVLRIKQSFPDYTGKDIHFACAKKSSVWIDNHVSLRLGTVVYPALVHPAVLQDAPGPVTAEQHMQTRTRKAWQVVFGNYPIAGVALLGLGIVGIVVFGGQWKERRTSFSKRFFAS